MISRIAARCVGNFLLAFATSFSGVTLVTGGKLDQIAMAAGLIVGLTHGALALAQELLTYANGKDTNSNASKAKNTIAKMLVF